MDNLRQDSGYEELSEIKSYVIQVWNLALNLLKLLYVYADILCDHI